MPERSGRSVVEIPDHRPLPGTKCETIDDPASVLAPVLESWIVRFLASPVDRVAVRIDGSELVCDRCSRHYSVRLGILCMLSGMTSSEQRF